VGQIKLPKWANCSCQTHAQGKQDDGRIVTVYSSDDAGVPDLVRAQAQSEAGTMFASIGVTVHWRTGRPSASETNAIAIEFVTNTAATLLPGALAYALPYEGVHIRIFWDRIEYDKSPRQLLAHVMVHEITHILQGIARHSAEGVMKAYWTSRDRSAMDRQALRFTPEDVALIYKGMDTRIAAHAPKPASATTSIAAVGLETK
jgi:hypothetical protein